MARRGGRDRKKEWYWRRMLRQWRRSGHTIRSFCREHDLAEPLFYAWRRTIQERDREIAHRSQLSRRHPKESAGGPALPGCQGDNWPAFVPVTIAPSPASLEVALGDGRIVRVPAGFDSATLRQLLAVLAETQPC
jgi:hypothetical protein